MVGINLKEVVSGQEHDNQFSDDTQESLVLVHHEEVVDEPVVMPKSLTGESVEPRSEELRALLQQFSFLRAICRHDFLCNISAGPV